MVDWDAATLHPRPDRVDGRHGADGRYCVGSGGFQDFAMSSHLPIMHYASRNCKRLLHYLPEYSVSMKTPNERLREARVKAGFESAVDAADALGVPRSTYIGHENGHRGFPKGRAPDYARKFKTTPEWLLFGKGVESPETVHTPLMMPVRLPSVDALTDMFWGMIQAANMPDIADELAPRLAQSLPDGLSLALAGELEGRTPALRASSRSATKSRRGQPQLPSNG